MGWNRDCGGGCLVPAPGRRAEGWSASGCPHTSLAPARWRRTSCQSLGCPTCCRQRNRVSPKAGTYSQELGGGGEKGLEHSPVTQTSRTQGLSPSDCGKLHPQGKRWKSDGGGGWVTRPGSRSPGLHGASQGLRWGWGSYLVLSPRLCSQEQLSSSQCPARSKK